MLDSVACFVAQGLRVAVGAILAALVAIVLWGVFTRFVLGAASWWTEEAARLLLIWLTMLGAAAASAARMHLGVDYFVNLLDPQARRLVAIATELAVILFAAAVLVYGGGVLVGETLRANQLTAALGIAMGYVYLAVPLGGFGMILFSLQRIGELLTGDDPPSDPALEQPTTDV